MRALVYFIWIAALAAAFELRAVNGSALAAPGDSATAAAGLPAGGEPGWSAFLTPGVLGTSLVLLLISAFFSASEASFFSLHKLHLRTMAASSSAGERLVSRLMEHPGSLLTCVLMGGTIANVLLSLRLAEPLRQAFSTQLGAPSAAALGGAVLATAGLIVLVADLLPRALVAPHAQRFAPLAAPFILVLDRLLLPLRDAMLFVVGLFFRTTGFSRMKPAPYITDEELVSVLSETEERGVFQRDEREMIQGIIEFGDMQVFELIVPRPDIVALRQTCTIGEALALYREQGYSRIPVYKDNIDNIVGILYAKDLLAPAEEERFEEPIEPLMRKPQFIPETMPVSDFVKVAQKQRAHMAIVVDEYGGTEGLITLEDALREAIGEIAEEDEEEAPQIEQIGEGVYRVDGGFGLHELEELTGVDFPDEEHTTVAGFIMQQTDRIPEPGEEIEFEGLLFTVEHLEGKRVASLLLQVMPQADSQLESAT